MKAILDFVKTTVLGGVLILVPAVVALLLVARVLGMVHGVLSPIAGALPGGPIVRETAAAVIIVGICFIFGLAVRTTLGDRLRAFLERQFARIPGFTLARSLARRVAGTEEGAAFQVALAEIEEALVPAFIVEEHRDGCYTVFVPSVPTPAAGAIYILPPERVHKVDVPFRKAVTCITRFGEGVSELYAAMPRPVSATR